MDAIKFIEVDSELGAGTRGASLGIRALKTAALNLNIDVVYNIADAINKIGFGLVIYTLAVKSSN